MTQMNIIIQNIKEGKMSKEFTPYQQALELKELGFDEPCIGFYNIDLNVLPIINEPYVTTSKDSAPLYQQAFRWFRERYGLFTSIIVDQTAKPKFYYNISEYYEDETTWEWKDGWGNSSLYRTYEEAELECLTKLIEIVEKQIDAADSKEALEYIRKGEFEILRTLCMGGPQISELNRLFTIMKTKYKYVK